MFTFDVLIIKPFAIIGLILKTSNKNSTFLLNLLMIHALQKWVNLLEIPV
jgi:hypothetical protein